MGRKPKPCPDKCPSHLFYLKPVHYSAYFSREFSIRYCNPNFKATNLMPKFNHDRKYFTFGFILNLDQRSNAKNSELFRLQHEDIVSENLQQKTEIYQPKPRTKSNTCSVCRVHYEDYLTHIHSAEHKQTLRANQFNWHILDLAAQFQNENIFETQVSSPIKLFSEASSTMVENVCRNRADSIQLSSKKLCSTETMPTLKSFKSFSDAQVLKNIDVQEELDRLLIWQTINEKLAQSRAHEIKDNEHSQGQRKQVEKEEYPHKVKVTKPIIISSQKLICHQD